MESNNCKYCGKELSERGKRLHHIFCSRGCSLRWNWENGRKRAETITIPCANCGKPVTREVNDWRFKKGVKLVFCNNDCHTEYSRSHRTPNTCHWCGKEFMHKYHNTLYCGNDCKFMAQRYKSYLQHHNPDISKEDFIALCESGNPFSYAGRELEYYKEYSKTNKKRLFQKRKEALENDEVEAYALKIKKRIQQIYARKTKNISSDIRCILGCSGPEFCDHIDQQLKAGMTVANYGKWQLDHIIPLSSAKSIDEVNRLCHYTNYQPLWRGENRKKSNKVFLREVKKPTDPI